MSGRNMFDIGKAFFVIDSENLDQVETKLYGYVVINNTLAEDVRALDGAEPAGDGAYIYISRTGDAVTVRQDYIGSYGLYLFRQGDYFALSNSFLYLVDHLKDSFRLTFNREYADYFVPAEMCSASFSETLINEIEQLDRSAVVEIDAAAKMLRLRYVDYGENTVPLDSEAGMELLDGWYHKWTGLIRNLQASGNKLQAALTGGFDSRMTFNLLLGAGIDMNDVFVESLHDDIHTHPEDYEIATDIAAHYGFRLNQTSHLPDAAMNYTVDDSLNLSFYTKLGFHKQMYHQFCRYEQPRHYFGGAGGEVVRAHWNMAEEEYVRRSLIRCKSYAGGSGREFENSLRAVLKRSTRQLKEKFARYGRPLDPAYTMLNLYRDTRCRVHFGKDFIEKYYGGIIKYSPLLDPMLMKLTLWDSSCSDRNLLMAVMLDRYNPELLSFRYDSGRKIDEATVAHAKELNRKYPYVPKPWNDAPMPSGTVRNNLPANQNPPITQEDVDTAVEQIFASALVRGTFESLYGEKTYRQVRDIIRNNTYYVLQDACSVIAVSKVLQDVLANENRFAPTAADALRSGALARPMYRGISQTALIHACMDHYGALRLDIEHSGDPRNDLELLHISDEEATASKPQWLAKNGHGYTIDSLKGDLELVLRCTGTGTLKIALRGRDIRDPQGSRIPFWIDLHQVELNGESCIDAVLPVCHDESLRLSREVVEGDEIRLNLEWTPHDGAQYSLPVPERQEPQPGTAGALKRKIAGLFR